MIILRKSNLLTGNLEDVKYNTVEEAMKYIESDEAKEELDKGIFFIVLDSGEVNGLYF